MVWEAIAAREDAVWRHATLGLPKPGNDGERASSVTPSLARFLRIHKGGVQREAYVDVGRSHARRMVVGLRSGWGFVREHKGRALRVDREKRRCPACDSGEVETTEHWLLDCAGPGMASARDRVFETWRASADTEGSVIAMRGPAAEDKVDWALAMDGSEAHIACLMRGLVTMRRARAKACSGRS